MAERLIVRAINAANPLMIELEVTGDPTGYTPGRYNIRQQTPPPSVDHGNIFPAYPRIIVTCENGDLLDRYRFLAVIYDDTDLLISAPNVDYWPLTRITANGQATSGGNAKIDVRGRHSITAAGVARSNGQVSLKLPHRVSASGSAKSDGKASLTLRTIFRYVTASGLAVSSGYATLDWRGKRPITATGSATSSGTAALSIATKLFVSASGSGTSNGSAALGQGRPSTIGAVGAARSNGRARTRLYQIALQPLPDIERMVMIALQSDPELIAFAGRIYTQLPTGEKRFPMLRLVRWGGTPPFSKPQWLDEASLQVDVWAATKREAQHLAQMTRAVMASHLVGVQTGGVITNVQFGTFAFDPDRLFTDEGKRTALARYRFDVSVTAHPRAVR